MAETGFALTYDGDALVTGRMPVRDLAPALLALGEIFAEATPLVAPGRPPATLDIQATERGSFEVHLILGGWDHIIDIFSSKDATALVTLKEAIIGGCGLFALIKKLHKKQVASVEDASSPGDITLKLDDTTTLTVPRAAWELYGNVEVRKKTRTVVEPLAEGTAEQLVFQSDDAITLQLGAADVPAYEPTPDVEAILPLGSQETDLVVAIVSVAFKEDNKWRLSDGERTFYASIRDDNFLHGVVSGAEAFRSGDMLRCKMRITQSSDAEGLHSDYEVLEVIEHIPRPTPPPQLTILSEEEPARLEPPKALPTGDEHNEDGA